jgi:predicted dehydrogenase
LVVQLGIIGYQNHAKRLISLTENNPKCNLQYIFHPNKKIDDKRGTNNLKDLLICDAIIISSPNSTHFEYIKKLSNFSGYIFCEKPPVTNLVELKKLKQLDRNKQRKIFFNFNYRFSELNKLLKTSSNSKKLGQIIDIRITASQGLAFKREYPKSWRANGKTNKHNLLETVAIHYLDLIIKNFGIMKHQSYFPRNISKNGTSYDTIQLILTYDNFNVSILNSYTTPFVGELEIIGTNGYLSIKNNLLKIHTPRNTFNKNNHFITPPVVLRKKFNIQKDYVMSLKKSFDFFISHAFKKKSFEKELFETSLLTTQLILENQISKKK